MQKTIKILLMIVSLNLILVACAISEVIENTVEAPTEAVTAVILEEIQPTESPEPEPTVEPAIFITEQIIQERSEDPAYEIDLFYPFLEGHHTVVKPFNAEIEYLVEVLREVFLADVTEREAQRGEDAMPGISTLELRYDLTYSDYPLVSIYLPITTYLAISPSPATVSFAYTYDARDGEFLLLGDLFLPDADHQGMILAAVEETLLNRDFGYQPGTAEEVLRRRPNWNILPEGLRINFDAYEVGPGAAGPQFVLIPWDEMIEFLNPDGPAGVFLSDG